MRPRAFGLDCVNHRVPSGPLMIAMGEVALLTMGNSVTTPLGVSRPILPLRNSVNQRLPSGPATMLRGPGSSKRLISKLVYLPALWAACAGGLAATKSPATKNNDRYLMARRYTRHTHGRVGETPERGTSPCTDRPT